MNALDLFGKKLMKRFLKVIVKTNIVVLLLEVVGDNCDNLLLILRQKIIFFKKSVDIKK